jgi:ABC-type glycerol-3-phosphate transport system substrate-binding protein
MHKLSIVAALALSALGSTAQAEPFTFAALGDAPYGKPEEVYKPYEGLIQAINAEKPDVVIHIGDTKPGSTPCSDQMLDDQLKFMNTFAAPVMYTPGDNEWTDATGRMLVSLTRLTASPASAPHISVMAAKRWARQRWMCSHKPPKAIPKMRA